MKIFNQIDNLKNQRIKFHLKLNVFSDNISIWKTYKKDIFTVPGEAGG